MTASIIALHSANIINNDLSKILFSDYAKVAAVRPIFKKYDRTDIKEYRPVSLLNCFSKVYEKFLNKQLLHFLNHSLSDFMSVYKKIYI